MTLIYILIPSVCLENEQPGISLVTAGFVGSYILYDLVKFPQLLFELLCPQAIMYKTTHWNHKLNLDNTFFFLFLQCLFKALVSFCNNIIFVIFFNHINLFIDCSLFVKSEFLITRSSRKWQNEGFEKGYKVAEHKQRYFKIKRFNLPLSWPLNLNRSVIKTQSNRDTTSHFLRTKINSILSSLFSEIKLEFVLIQKESPILVRNFTTKYWMYTGLVSNYLELYH